MADAGSSKGNGEEEAVISMVDVLEEEKQYEEDAKAVLGGSDPNQCTYEHGYLPRQALYACATCVKPDMAPAGICLACSLECHDGHELYELYTKRYFRCDCGNSKFRENKCQFFPERDDMNERNTYNQNFTGAYCTCNRPYPDPEDEIEDDMIQCAICEDWYHGRHTGCDTVPEDYDEFICEACCKKHTFLLSYATLYPKQNELEKTQVKPCDETAQVNVEPTSEVKPNAVETAQTERQSTTENEKEIPSQDIKTSSGDEQCIAESTPKSAESKSDETVQDAKDTENARPEEKCERGSCLLQDLKKNDPAVYKSGGRFWPEGWRNKLCVCDSCKAMYSECGISYLCDEKDTIGEYEKRGKTAEMGSYEKGIEALRTIDRTQQVEVLTEYASMKNQLTDYLKKFAESGKVVREEDIKEFFEGLKANKRQRTGVQYFCR